MTDVKPVPKNRLLRHYESRARQLRTQFDDVRDVMSTHEGSKGTRIEKILRDRLTEHLPRIYEYASGIVVDSAEGEVDFSRQQDVLVVDRLFNPRLFLDEEPSVYPVEVVYAGIEIKTEIDLEEMKGAFRNVARLRTLKVMPEPVWVSRAGNMNWESLTPPVGVVFAFTARSRDVDTILCWVETAAKGIPEDHWPDVICILDRGIIRWHQREQAKEWVFHHTGFLVSDGDRLGEAEWHPTSVRKEDIHFVTIDGRTYPTVEYEGHHKVVDPARVFTRFLTEVNGLLAEKVVPDRSNLLDKYVPAAFRRSLEFTRRRKT